jgi:hypothetical protein
MRVVPGDVRLAGDADLLDAPSRSSKKRSKWAGDSHTSITLMPPSSK